MADVIKGNLEKKGNRLTREISPGDSSPPYDPNLVSVQLQFSAMHDIPPRNSIDIDSEPDISAFIVSHRSRGLTTEAPGVV